MDCEIREGLVRSSELRAPCNDFVASRVGMRDFLATHCDHAMRRVRHSCNEVEAVEKRSRVARGFSRDACLVQTRPHAPRAPAMFTVSSPMRSGSVTSFNTSIDRRRASAEHRAGET